MTGIRPGLRQGGIPPGADSLESVAIARPGFLGLNLETAGVGLDPGWATEATNAVIDETGAVATRKGWVKVNASAISGTPNVIALDEYLKADGTSIIVSATSTKIFSGTSTLTEITPTVAPTDGHWKFVNFNNKIYGVQRGQDAVVWAGTGLMTLLKNEAGFVDSSDAVIGTLKPNEALAAYGRIWVADTATEKMTVWWCDSLAAQTWGGGTPGSSGKLDLRSVLTSGMDEITALRAWNGFLIIFLKNNIVIYDGAKVTPADLSLVEVVNGIGCIARDSVQAVGTDLLFLSASGVRSLGRTIQEKSMPVGDVSKNVRSFLLSYVDLSAVKQIKSVYFEPEAFYLLMLPSASYSVVRTFCFDLRRQLDDGTYRVTLWDQINPKAFLSTRSQDLYFGQAGHIGQYAGWQDNGVGYNFSYISSWQDLGTHLKKIIKRLHCLAKIESNNAITFKWAVNYTDNFNSVTSQAGNFGEINEWNIMEWGLGEWGAGGSLAELQVPGSRTGEVIKFGVFKTMNSATQGLSIQKMDILCKLGRTR